MTQVSTGVSVVNAGSVTIASSIIADTVQPNFIQATMVNFANNLVYGCASTTILSIAISGASTIYNNTVRNIS